MENKSMKSTDENYEVATETADIEEMIVIDDEVDFDKKIVFDEEVIANYEVENIINKPLINQKLQDFYDLIALQNQHPEFNNEVMEQLKNYTNDSIINYTTDKVVIIKNLQQIGETSIINNSTQKIKLRYTKVSENIEITDTIYAIITSKPIMINNESLVSNKVRFSMN
jgi:hypothetical protein